jgi:hypothetical protein
MVYPLTCTKGPPYWREKVMGQGVLVRTVLDREPEARKSVLGKNHC